MGNSKQTETVKSLGLTRELQQYLVEHGTPPDDVLSELRDETREKIGQLAMMQIAPEQGAFLTFMAELIGARRAIEVGTFTGYSALCIARALPEDGQLICCDTSREWTDVGRPYWERAGVAKRIDLRIAPALETLAALPADHSFDFAFVDAHKPEYPEYLEHLTGLVRPGGLILIDNVLWSGSVIDPERQDESTVAIRAFNEAVARDERFDRVMVAISDGITMLRVR